MEKTRVKLEIKKVGTFKKAQVKNAALDTGDPTSTLTSTTTTVSDLTFGHLRHR